MLPIKRIVAVAATAFAGALAPAQSVGSTPPTFEIEKAWNEGPKGFDDFAGKVVILDFAQTW